MSEFGQSITSVWLGGFQLLQKKNHFEFIKNLVKQMHEGIVKIYHSIIGLVCGHQS